MSETSPVSAQVEQLELDPQVGGAADGDSDVFFCRRPSSPEPGEVIAQDVTLFVFGWHNVQPGPLSWAFPSLRAALEAVRTMKNAIQWCIVSGSDWTNMDDARSQGAVLIEQVG